MSTGVQNDLRNGAEQAAEVLKGFKVEVVGDRIIVTPQSSIQSWTIFEIQAAARSAGLEMSRLLSDVLIHFPGEADRVPDVSILADGAEEPYTFEDVLAAIEIVSSRNDGNDYAIKRKQYARFGIPTYLIVDPFRGECDLLTRPRGEDYTAQVTYTYGETIPLRLPDGSEVRIPTGTFRRRD
ncbi:Uma2 family endonuclease [Streptomyces sp. URMC 123]|uniref:Uma2 family endonuclease n=1 Tax=Streptomyces sp. URMC 123 TaxID=3423403 RepID=UPI003F1CE078